ncbi:MAG: OmpA family protein [Sulfuricaulis sp.]|nr:OmpA family protein [Sulfuricaulis sp.]
MQHYRFLPTALLAVATLAGCASVPENNSLLNEARNDYSAAQNNPQVVNLAPGELKQAGDALGKANDASNKKEDAAAVTHLAYLAKQRVAIAQETAKQKEAETAVTNAGTERSEIRLEARTDEANKAQQSAEASQRQAEASQQQAAMSQQQSEMSQQQARDAEMRTSQLETQLKELNAKKTERGLVITLGDVLFDTNKAQLKSGRTHSLQKLADFLKQYPQRKARVEGYTDSTGGADYNQGLSDRRAYAVRTSLVDMGIGNDRISTHGYGKESPVASNDSAAGRQLNRRVEIILSDDNGNFSSR